MRYPCLFNNKLNNYKNMEKKGALWQEKVKEMEVEVALLKIWFECMRTRFGRLMKRSQEMLQFSIWRGINGYWSSLTSRPTYSD